MIHILFFFIKITREKMKINFYLGYSERTPTSAIPASSLHAESLVFSRLPKPLFIEGIDNVETGFRSYFIKWKKEKHTIKD